jgi:hypothetical protein
VIFAERAGLGRLGEQADHRQDVGEQVSVIRGQLLGQVGRFLPGGPPVMGETVGGGQQVYLRQHGDRGASGQAQPGPARPEQPDRLGFGILQRGVNAEN